MLRILQQLILTSFFAIFASQATAMFIQPDWLDPTQPGVGTNRYSYCYNDPINCIDPSGNTAVSPEEAEDAVTEQAEREDRQDTVREAGPSGLAGKVVRSLERMAAKKAAQRELKYARQRAVMDAWKMERQLAIKGFPTTRDWTKDQLTELIGTGRVKGFVGDHINTVNENVSLAANHRNIQFSTTAEHNARHAAAGGFRTPISGQPMIDRTLGGQLPDLATPTARGWTERARSLGLTGLSGVAFGLEVMDQFDPVFGPNGFFGARSMACGSLDC